MKKHILIEIISCLLIILFVYTGVTKLFDYSNFKKTLQALPFINDVVARVLAIVFPIMELLISFLLFMPALRRKGFFSSSILLLIFSTYIACLLIFSLKLPCSCGGVIKYLTWKQHLAFNIFFLFLSIMGIKYSANEDKSKMNQLN